MHIVKLRPVNTRHRMYLPGERYVVNDDDGNLGFSINLGKMFRRMTKVTKTSFRPKNIFGAIGSGASNFLTFGTASAFAPKLFSAHSKTMRTVGMGVSAAALAAGAVVTGGALAPALGGFLSSTGGMLLSAGGGLLKMLPTLMSSFTKKGSGAQTQYQYQDPQTGLVTQLPPGVSPEQAIQTGMIPMTQSGAGLLPGSLTVTNESLPGYGKPKTIIPGIDDNTLVGGIVLVGVLGTIYYIKRKKR